MCDNNKFYICEHCGNLIGMIHDAGVPMMCCGQKMTKLEPGVVEASHEKHIPVVTVEDNIVTVTIGSVEHPMLKNIISFGYISRLTEAVSVSVSKLVRHLP